MTNWIRAIAVYAFFPLFFGFGCTSLKVGDSWKMLPDDQTIGLTLLWELPEAQLKVMLPAGQQPRIRQGKGVLMLFLASTTKYTLGDKSNGSLAIAHLLIPLEKHLGTPHTIVSRKQALYDGLAQLDFPVQDGEVTLTLLPEQDSIRIDGGIQFSRGKLSFSGKAGSQRGNLVDLPLTTLVGKHLDRNYLSGPESYRPLPMSKIKVNSEGENWMSTFGLTQSPDRIWVNVDFLVDFAYQRKIANSQLN
ncbi:MAG: hypothetical protein NBV57_01235 [Algoriphagus sp.]|nr:hypothetical protein [Algoriphagus sp.]